MATKKATVGVVGNATPTAVPRIAYTLPPSMAHGIPLAKPKFLVLHITDSQPNVSPDDLVRYWQGIPWYRPGYHDLVLPDGKVVGLQSHKFRTNGVKDYAPLGLSNANAIHICCTGGRLGKAVFQQTTTAEQEATVIALVKEYLAMYPDLTIVHHCQVARKACPLKDWREVLVSAGVPRERVFWDDRFAFFGWLRDGKWAKYEPK